jgi:DGQHR domain-containing protein
MSNIKITCIEVTQPIETFYVGKINWQDLLKIAKRDIERIRQEGEGSIDGYLGIQRELSKNRLAEIAEYVSFNDATFPNSIVISIDSTSYNEANDEIEENILSFENGILELRDDGKIAKIIDGQHRVFGLEKYATDNGLFKDELKFELIITIFIDIDEEYQANIFSTINKAQTKVNKSHVYDLYSFSKTRSPQRTSHNVIKLLNEEEDSPFYHLIKRLGKADFKNETIAQATLADCIIKYISNNPPKDRNILRTGAKLAPVEGAEKDKYFFRNWFIKEEDVKIAKVIWNYFEAIKRKWPIAWGNLDFILTKSTGVIAFMRFLKDLVELLGMEKIITVDDFKGILNKIEIKDTDLVNDVYQSGGVGQSALYKVLISSIKNSEVIICKKAHRYDDKFMSLNDSQEFYMEGRRHQCAGCAYELGYKDAIAGKQMKFRVEELNISQAGTVRHKDPKQAYELGYKEGLKTRND